MSTNAREYIAYNKSWTCPGGVFRLKVSPIPPYFGQISTHLGAVMAMDTQGGVFAWGSNIGGQLGTNVASTTTGTSSPVQIVGGLTFKQILWQPSGLSGGAAIDVRNNMYCWGSNNSGTIGDNTTVVKSSPVLVLGNLRWWKFCDYQTPRPQEQPMAALDENGNAWTWGRNDQGILGANLSPGTTLAVSSPVQVVGGIKFVSLSICSNIGGTTPQAHGVDVNGDAWSWGNNNFFQLGDNTTLQRSSPVLVLGGIKWKRVIAADAQNSINFAAGISTDDVMYIWGGNSGGVLGRNLAPTSVGSLGSPGTSTPVLGGLRWRSDVYAFGAPGNSRTAGAIGAITLDNDLYTWGDNTNGSLGLGDTTPRSSPVQVMSGTKFIKCMGGQDFFMMLDTAGNLWGAGVNSKGQLGDGTTTNRSSPVQVVGGLRFADFWVDNNATGTSRNVVGVTFGGLLYCWGDNSSGQIGDGTSVAKSSPVQVVGAKTWQPIQPQPYQPLAFDVTPGVTYAVKVLGPYATFNGVILGPAQAVLLEYDQ